MTSSPLSANPCVLPAQLVDLLGQSGQGYAIWNAEGHLLMATPAWCQWFDVPPDSATGQPLQPLLSDAVWQTHSPRFTAAGKGQRQEYDDTRHDDFGAQRHRRIQLTPGAADAQGRHEVLMTLNDVGREYARGTVITRQHEQLKSLQEQLRSHRDDDAELEKLRTLLDWRTAMLTEHNEMLQLLSHEIRQPLNNASAAMQATLKAIDDLHLADATPATKALLRAEHVLQQVIGTLDNTLAAGTILAVGGKAGASSETDLPTLIKLVLHDIAADLRPRIDVQWQAQPRTVQLHPALMRLTIRNLLHNALAYAPAETQVALRISESDEPLALILEVIDQGPGIPAELLPRLFDKGSRGNHSHNRPGAGLGLFIVRSVLQLHQGTVEALPLSPHGTVMRLIIPQGLAE
ncbi:PAS domain-containing sensor histidine kinase [Comamonas sp. 26]|uniref:sensor histidine kinase n=1 Tax=Comamonas sp. 26 TaxID=2035201 RepID=UPI000C184CE3|nr:PAS domain-containing sensor histidine kinase [Comamonas sp. 26]PIG07213.1 PAS domain-containing protein [Comamonas sp. 26]